MPKFSLFFARFPFGNAEAPSVTNWMIDAILWAKSSPLVGDIYHDEYDDTPITMTRNRAMYDAQAKRADFIVMVDSDMWPDVGLSQKYAIEGAKPFLPNALQFAVNHSGPCVVGMPYCGPPPHENVYVFKPSKRQNDSPNFDFSVEQYTREEAFQRDGFEQVMALPTGCILIDMRCMKTLKDPFFAYEWTDHRQLQKGSTEDVYFSRNLALAGVPQYVYWPAWGGHHKRKLVTKPSLVTIDQIIKEYRDAIVRGQQSDEKLIMVGEGKKPLDYSETAKASLLEWDEQQKKAEVTNRRLAQHLFNPAAALASRVQELATSPVGGDGADEDDEC